MVDHRELAARLLRVCCHVGNRAVNGVMQEASAALSDIGDRLQDALRELADTRNGIRLMLATGIGSGIGKPLDKVTDEEIDVCVKSAKKGGA